MKSTLLSLLIFSFFSCAGTETGNPVKPDPNAGQCEGSTRNSIVINCMPTPYSRVLVGRISDKVLECTEISDPTEVQKVYDSILKQVGLHLEMPLLYKSFEELTVAYDQKKLNVNAQSFTQCLGSIHSLSCDNEAFKASFDVAQPADFSAIHRILRVDDDCNSIFSEKETL